MKKGICNCPGLCVSLLHLNCRRGCPEWACHVRLFPETEQEGMWAGGQVGEPRCVGGGNHVKMPDENTLEYSRLLQKVAHFSQGRSWQWGACGWTTFSCLPCHVSLPRCRDTGSCRRQNDCGVWWEAKAPFRKSQQWHREP